MRIITVNRSNGVHEELDHMDIVFPDTNHCPLCGRQGYTKIGFWDWHGVFCECVECHEEFWVSND